jgi:glycerol dehydrogenase
MWATNPDVIIADTEVIAKAPVRFFVAGMGDALATWPEASTCFAKRAIACTGGVQTITAMSMARLCFDTILEYGLEARSAVERKVVTAAVDRVVEANILLSGVGWESGGLATAHAIANSLPLIHETHGLLHGEKVSFGLITQLCLDQDLSVDEVYRIVDFQIAVGLPVTLSDMKMQDVSRERLLDFAKSVSGEGSFVHNHPFTILPTDIVDAMFAADSLGTRRKHRSQ